MAKKPQPAANTSQLTIHYIKGSAFRTVHCDGVHGGPSPQGLVQMAVFSERFAIPQQVVHQIDDGGLGKELERTTRPGIVREVEVNVLMTPEKARKVADWLTRHADQADRLVKDASNNKPKRKQRARKK